MRTVKTSAALFAFWCVVVPPAGPPDVVVGASLALVVGLWAARFLWPHADPFFSRVRLSRLPGFVVRTVWRVLVASLQVTRIVLHPRLPIAPEVVRHTARFGSDAARAAFANAITITPGTLTLDVDGDVFVVHCLDPSLAGDLSSGRLARDIDRLFAGRGGA
jgi:multicomponent Na+:H+ antiporter subunit E